MNFELVTYRHMDLLLSELAASLPDPAQAVQITIRFFAAIAVGAIVGFEREQTGKRGLRTHLLVSVASALFVLAPLEGGMSTNDVSRVIKAWRQASASSGRAPS